MKSYMEVLLVMPPGLEMWFGEWDWIDWWEDDEDWPEEAGPHCVLVWWYPEVGFFSHNLIS
jgi:hypothetical protein